MRGSATGTTIGIGTGLTWSMWGASGLSGIWTAAHGRPVRSSYVGVLRLRADRNDSPEPLVVRPFVALRQRQDAHRVAGAYVQR
jgi:hypothetical protein